MTKTTTERQNLRDNHPDSWIPVEPGDSIKGKVVDVADAWSDQRRDPLTDKQGSRYPLLTILADEAIGYEDRLPCELKVHGFGAVLFNEIMRKQPSVGEAILITYQGPGKAKPGQSAPELYSVRAAAGSESVRKAYDNIPVRHASPQQGGEQTSMDDQSDIPF